MYICICIVLWKLIVCFLCFAYCLAKFILYYVISCIYCKKKMLKEKSVPQMIQRFFQMFIFLIRMNKYLKSSLFAKYVYVCVLM